MRSHVIVTEDSSLALQMCRVCKIEGGINGL